MNVCVVIPAYNAAGFITEALDSVARQSTPADEIVVVNDGSKDATAHVVRRWIAAHPACNVRLVEQVNGGIPVARNAGIRASAGAWIALLDADDLWEQDHLAALQTALALAPDAVAAYGAGRVWSAGVLNPRLYDEFWDHPSRRFGQPIAGTTCLRIGSAALGRLIQGNFIKPSSLCFSRAAAMRVGLFDESLKVSEDREFLIRLLLDGDFIYTPCPITCYRWHDENATNGKNSMRNAEYALRALRRIHLNSASALNRAQRHDLHAEIRTAIRSYLYTCARDGWHSYYAGVHLVNTLFGRRRLLVALRIQHLLHCLRPALFNVSN
jgi:glycosyltransferase involved in cell wall biosynthesis